MDIVKINVFMHRNIETAFIAIVRTARWNLTSFEVFEMHTNDFVDFKSSSAQARYVDTDTNKDKVQ